ncbi:MAG: histidinol-phosphatase HisJ [Acidobacteria bacterium]|nr:histidinol-phosphatase HisJ [Acidobacteriota bacterium]MCI0721243.1 histidinol-phosphatase HisJ [Acidobacteriota bacterium]
MSGNASLSRRDGHTHTQFCPHGSREATGQFICRAIELGFEVYSLTEHPPLPPSFIDPTPDKSCGMQWEELDSYLSHAREQQEQFAGRIEVRVGLEVDYIPGYESEVREMLNRYGAQLDDALLSVHFLQGKGGWRCVDLSPDDFHDGLVDAYGSVEAVHEAYWAAVKQAVEADLGPYKPRRLSHLSLAHKFQLQHPLKNPQHFRPHVLEILDRIQERSMELDLNAAGLFKPDCREIYPAPWIIEEAVKRGIPLVYGSDTHSVKGVGQGFDEAQRILNRFPDSSL